MSDRKSDSVRYIGWFKRGLLGRVESDKHPDQDGVEK